MLDDLVLLRVWAAPDPVLGETRSRVAGDLRPVADDPARSGRAWRAAFAEAVERLTAAGDLISGGRQGARLRLTDHGRQRVQTRFRIPAEDAATHDRRRPARGWAWWRDHHALPLAFDGERTGTAGEVRTALLRRFYLPELSGHGRGDSLTRTVDLLLAKRLGLSQVSSNALRQAALRIWAVREPATGSTKAAGLSADELARLTDDLPVFAARALDAARRSPTGRFGESKVFVSHVWRTLLAAGQAGPEDGPRFKEQLVRANTAGLLRLSRADLTGAHDGEDVRESVIEYLGERFHFLRLD